MFRFMAVVVMLVFPKVALANTGHALLSAKGRAEQAVFLALAVRSAEMDCPQSSARNPFFQGFDSNGSAYWNITCGKNSFAVSIRDDAEGTSSAMPCSFLKTLGVYCYTKLD